MEPFVSYCTLAGWKHDWNKTRDRHPKINTKAKSLVHVVWNTYTRNPIVNLNATTIIAAAPSIKAAGYASALAETVGLDENMRAIVAGIVDYSAYLPIHGVLHYVSNRAKFQKSDGVIDKRAFARDVLNTHITSIPSLATFYTVAGPLQSIIDRGTIFNQYLFEGLDASSANQLAYWSTLLLTRAIHTFNAQRAGLFDKYRTNSNEVKSNA